ncbi:GAF domain-containing protein [Haloactinospora alba]|uniref:GAF domain-containing protein n=1 Tax=Haloactinospora alba TaxID=405555 RepID=A0A543NIV6_9ACTN|nr:GAF and ANTAR domain-containing protein [Haloactinospora alba]TQN31768.1 GAF domain-containing protein [Haloactinospora alba]
MHTRSDQSLSPGRIADLVRSLFVGPDMQDALQRIADSAVDLVGGCDYAGVSVTDGEGGIRTLCYTHGVVLKHNTLQSRVAEGPCVDVAEGVEFLHVADLAHEHRWPHYAAEASELPFGSMLLYRLFTRTDVLGVLAMYSDSPDAFPPHTHEVGTVLSAHATAALAASHHIANLNRALKTRETIGQAQGILMERHRMTPDQAWEHLRAVSQDRNVKVAQLAEQISRTGEDPHRTVRSHTASKREKRDNTP